MRLVALATAAGRTLADCAAALHVQPLLLSRIDAGLQACPYELAARLAPLLEVTQADVIAACALTTKLREPRFYNALPPMLGERFRPARLAMLKSKPVPRPQVGDLWFGDEPIPGDFIVPDEQPYLEIFDGEERIRTALPKNTTELGQVAHWTLEDTQDSAIETAFVPLAGGGAYASIYANLGDDGDGGAVLKMDSNGGVLAALYPFLTYEFAQQFGTIAKDPASDNVWGRSTQTLYRFGYTDFTLALELTPSDTLPMPDSFSVHFADIKFLEGSLYVLAGNGRIDFSNGVGIYQIDPTPGAEAPVAVTPAPELAANDNRRWTYDPGGDCFYVSNLHRAVAGDAYVLKVPRSTLALEQVGFTAPDPDPWTHTTLSDVVYVPDTDTLWMLLQQDDDNIENLFRSVLVEVAKTGGAVLQQFVFEMPAAAGLEDTRTIIERMIRNGSELWMLVDQRANPDTASTYVMVFDTAVGTVTRTYQSGANFPEPSTTKQIRFI